MTSLHLPSLQADSHPVIELARLRPPTSHLTRLPEELFDHVIGHLSGDKTTLKICSLVCRSWVHFASQHLFARVLWPPCYHLWPSFAEPSGKEPDTCKCNTLNGDFEYLAELLPTLPRMSTAVVELQLRSARKTDHPVYIWQNQDLSPQTLFAIWDSLPRLRSLHFVNCMYPHNYAFPSRYLPRSIEIVRFQVSWESVSQGSHALQLLRCFDHISELLIEGISCEVIADEGPSPPRTSNLARVDHLEYNNSSSPPPLRRRRRNRISDVPWLPHLAIIQSQIDLSSIRAIRTQVHSNPLIQGLVRGASNLSSLTYNISPEAVSFSASARMVSVAARYHVPFNKGLVSYDRDWAWPSLVRDFQTILLRDFKIVQLIVVLHEVYDSPELIPPPEHQSLGSLVQFFQNKNWTWMSGFVGRSLERFSIDIQDSCHYFKEYRDLVAGAVFSAIEPQLSGQEKDLLNVTLTDICL